MGVEDHLLCLTRAGTDKRHPAMAEPNMGDLHCGGHAIDQNNFMAPVELIGLTGVKTERHIGRRRGFPRRLRPVRRIPAHSIVAAIVTPVAKLLVNPNQRQPLALGVSGVLGKHLIQIRPPRIDLGARLVGAIIAELRRTGPDHLANRVPRHPQFPADLLDRLLPDKIRQPDLRNRLQLAPSVL